MKSDYPACSCIQGYVSSPPNCRPECTINSECSGNQACINQKCRDPCPGSCGINAKCAVVNHNAVCSCNPGYTGDPFKGCSIYQGRIFFITFTKITNMNILYFVLADCNTHYIFLNLKSQIIYVFIIYVCINQLSVIFN